MWRIPLFLIAGIVAGRILRDRKRIVAGTGRLLMISIFVLLFILGVGIGSNKEIIGQIGSLGLTAAGLGIFAIAGSILAGIMIQRFFPPRNEK